MVTGLLGALFAIAILCVIAYAIIQILAHFGATPPPVVVTIIWAVVTVVCIVLLAQGLGINIPGFSGA